MQRSITLEICVASVEDALAAAAGGADRLELNSALALGGLTPSPGLFRVVRQRVNIPIIAMVRPRSGGFCYSESEFAVMCQDAEMLCQAGADGLAFGILTPQREVDVERCRVLRNICGNREAVFHRAFDLVADPMESLRRLVDLGFSRLMTSGQKRSAQEGTELIARLVQEAGDRIGVLPATGLRPGMIREFLQATRCNQVHASLSRVETDPTWPVEMSVRFCADRPAQDHILSSTDPEAVREMREKISQPGL